MDAGAQSHEEDAYVQLNFAPNVRLVSTVRRFVSDFFAEILGSAEHTSVLAMAAHELLENAVRYSSDGHSQLRVGVKRRGATATIRIETRNRVDAAGLARARAALDAVTSATDPAAFYLEAMRRTAKQTEGSGLGLGRIRAEAEMDLSYAVEVDMVIVCAKVTFGTEKP